MTAPEIIILGAHTAVGRSLMDRLADRGIDGVVAATTSEFVEADLLLIDEGIVTRTGLFVLAMPGELTRKVAEALGQRGQPVLDLTGAFEASPWLWPSLTPGRVPEPGVHRIATGPAAPLASVLSALTVFRPRVARVTTLESAVARGKPGLDELSEQTRAAFAMRDVDPAVFPASLAFDPIPSLEAGEGHPHEADAALTAEVQAALQAVGQPALDLVVTRVLVPTFVADSVVVHVETEDPAPELATVVDAVTSGRGLRHVQRSIVPALDAVDRDDTLVSRVRVGPHHLDFWMVYDRTRAGSAVPAALAVEAYRNRHGPEETGEAGATE